MVPDCTVKIIRPDDFLPYQLVWWAQVKKISLNCDFQAWHLNFDDTINAVRGISQKDHLI